MSSFVRRIQTDKDHFMGRGSRLGDKNPKAKDLLARLQREKKHRKATS